MAKILLLTMGGTIDAARYSEIEGEYPPNATMTEEIPSVDFLRSLVSADNLDWTMICHKDSKEITPDDEQHLFHHIKNAQNYERIIVTTGTDRMKKIAMDLKHEVTALNCPVIFTGSIWPLANQTRSDGPENLTIAALTQDLDTAIYIAVGDVFAPAEYAEKNYKERKFVDLRHKGA